MDIWLLICNTEKMYWPITQTAFNKGKISASVYRKLYVVVKTLSSLLRYHPKMLDLRERTIKT